MMNNNLPKSIITTSSWAYSRISPSHARILSKLVLLVTSYSNNKAKKIAIKLLKIHIYR